MIDNAPNEHRRPEERQAVVDYPVELFDETITVGEIFRKYRIDALIE